MVQIGQLSHIDQYTTGKLKFTASFEVNLTLGIRDKAFLVLGGQICPPPSPRLIRVKLLDIEEQGTEFCFSKLVSYTIHLKKHHSSFI